MYPNVLLIINRLAVALILLSFGAAAQGTITGVGTYNGNTLGAVDDCGLRAGEDYYYEFTPSASGCVDYTFSLCSTPTAWDSYMFILDDTNCGTANIIAQNDDACGLYSSITAALSSGTTYYIYIEAFSAGNAGPFTLDVTMSSSSTTTSQFNIVGTGGLLGGDEECVELTSASNTQQTCAWHNYTYNFAAAFTDTFTVNLGSNDAGADGICFVIHADPRGECACAEGGGSLAYGGSNSIQNSIGFEIDTYMSTEDRNDFTFPCNAGSCSDPDHVAIHLNGDWENPTVGAIPLMDGASEYNIETGGDHMLIVDWDGTTITYTLQSMDGLTVYATLSYAFDPLVLFGTNSPFFGFTGSTGGLNNQQSFCSPLPTSCLPPDWIGN